MATIFGAENISCSAVSTCCIPTSAGVEGSLDVNSATSVARRQISRARRASPDKAATWQVQRGQINSTFKAFLLMLQKSCQGHNVLV